MSTNELETLRNMANPGRAQLQDARSALNYILAGNAKVTLVSKKTGTRFTYRVREPNPTTHNTGAVQAFSKRKILFVSLLTGPDNDTSYSYLGQIYPSDMNYQHGRKSRISVLALSAKAFAWFWDNLQEGKIPDQLEVWHEGTCGKCGRSLTDPQSIARGIGPVCAAGV